jgi:adenine-specific DNA-methyltransferase
MTLRRIHLFESRSAAFRGDSVLQENVIVHATKTDANRDTVVVSISNGSPGAPVTKRTCAYKEVVAPDDARSFIHVVPHCSGVDVREKVAGLQATLSELGLKISTGRVVDFRATEFLRHQAGANTVPLIRPCHFEHGLARWPAKKERKPCAILDVESTRNLLVPRGNYVLVKRFSAKEEKRRVVATAYDPTYIESARVGFENHLNYFHSDGKGFGKKLARGLTAFLNSTIVDMYFRHFSGHTQVNATDLRSLRYPSSTQLENLGAKVGTAVTAQHELDEIVSTEVF